MNKTLIAFLCIAIATSGCTQLLGEDRAGLMSDVSDKKVTAEDPGEITLNAKNMGKRTSFYVQVEPVGDYRQIVRITDREGKSQNRFNLGEAVEGATTGEKFAQVRKKMNVTANVQIEIQLYSNESKEVLDTERVRLNTVEE